MLDLTCLENVKQRGGKVDAACPACREEGRDKAGDNLRIFDGGGYRCAAVDDEGHRARIWALAGARPASGAQWPVARRPVAAKPPGRAGTGKPRLPSLRPLTMAEMAAIAARRGWCLRVGLEILTVRGLLWHGRVFDGGAEHPAWVVTDSTRRNAQARRLDGEPWVGIGGAKAKTLAGSEAGWPIGAPEIGSRPRVMLCEGGPDFLASLLVAWWLGRADEVAPVMMSGTGHNIPAEALGFFSGKDVEIAADNDDAGREAAGRWASQLAGVAESVEVCDFSAVRLADGKPCKDLSDFATTLALPEAEPGESGEVSR